MILYWRRKEQELAAAAELDIPGPLQAERSGGVTQPPVGLRHRLWDQLAMGPVRGLVDIRLLFGRKISNAGRVARVVSGAIPSFSPVPIGLLTPLVLKLAARNLLYDKLRFAATVTGIVFSIVLVTIQLGLFVSFERMVTIMIDHAPADLWIVLALVFLDSVGLPPPGETILVSAAIFAGTTQELGIALSEPSWWSR